MKHIMRMPVAGIILFLSACAGNRTLTIIPPGIEEPILQSAPAPVKIENTLLGFSVEIPGDALSRPVVWDKNKQQPPSFIQNKPSSAMHTYSTGIRVMTGDAEVIVRASSAEQADRIPAWEYEFFDSPSPTGNYEELVSSSVFISTSGVEGVEFYRASASPTVRLKYGITGPVRQFRLDPPKKLWDTRLLSVLIFPSPASRDREKAALLAESIAMSFSYTSEYRSMFNEDDYGKLLDVRIPAAAGLTLPAQENCVWTQEAGNRITLSKETRDSARLYWNLTIKKEGLHEISMLCMKTGETEPALRYNLRIRASK